MHGPPGPYDVVGVRPWLALFRDALPHPLRQPFRDLFGDVEHLQMSFPGRKLELLNAFGQLG